VVRALAQAEHERAGGRLYDFAELDRARKRRVRGIASPEDLHQIEMASKNTLPPPRTTAERCGAISGPSASGWSDDRPAPCPAPASGEMRVDGAAPPQAGTAPTYRTPTNQGNMTNI
jgi:hypothetical protein